MEWDQITEKWAVMIRRLCHDDPGAALQTAAPSDEAPLVPPLASTLVPLVSASPDP